MTGHHRRFSLAAGAVAVAALGAASAPVGIRAAPSAAAAASAPPAEVAVYAAASLRDALGALAPICERRTETKTVFNFGASNDLARQILAADKADLFLSADEGWMDKVAEAGLVDTPTRRPLLSNRLVVVVPADSKVTIGSGADLAGDAVKRLSLANPDAVPAGKYAKAWFEKIGLWERVRDRVVPATDVRAALAAVEAEATDAAVVYRTDAAIAKRLKVAWAVPESEAPKIVHPVAAMQHAPHREPARRVLDCYAGKEAREVFERFGFVIIEASEGGSAAPSATGR